MQCAASDFRRDAELGHLIVDETAKIVKAHWRPWQQFLGFVPKLPEFFVRRRARLLTQGIDDWHRIFNATAGIAFNPLLVNRPLANTRQKFQHFCRCNAALLRVRIGRVVPSLFKYLLDERAIEADECSRHTQSKKLSASRWCLKKAAFRRSALYGYVT